MKRPAPFLTSNKGDALPPSLEKGGLSRTRLRSERVLARKGGFDARAAVLVSNPPVRPGPAAARLGPHALPFQGREGEAP